MRFLGPFFGIFLSISTVCFGQDYLVPSCKKEAEAAIRNTIRNMGVKKWVSFAFDSAEIVEVSYDGAPIMRYGTNHLFSRDGFFPGASVEVLLVLRETCDILRIDVDLNITRPQQKLKDTTGTD
jgi:hypothetical protein